MTTETVDYNGETYHRHGSGWIDSHNFKPPMIVAQALDRLARPILPPPITPSPKRSGVRPIGRMGRDFTGLAPSDFKNNVHGTRWRAKAALGGLLAQAISDRTGRTFLSHSIDRKPLVFFGEPPRFDSNNADKVNFRKAKFYFRLDPEGADFGFYIEKEDKVMDDSWEWPNFLRALQDAAMTSSIEQAMADQSLHWFAQHYEGSENGPRTNQTLRLGAPLVQADDTGERPITWRTFAQQLDAVDPLDWYDVFLRRQVPRDEVLALGVGIVDLFVQTCHPLLSLYDACGRK